MTNFVTPAHPERFTGKYGPDTGGRLAERHPNSYPSEPSPNETWLKAQGAANLLSWWRNSPTGNLPPKALLHVTRAYELLSDLTHELPRVYGFICRYELRAHNFSRPMYSEFSAHESLVDAIRWCQEWERKLPRGDGDKSTGPWEIAWAPARIIEFRVFGSDPKVFIRRG